MSQERIKKKLEKDTVEQPRIENQKLKTKSKSGNWLGRNYKKER